jgi:hypothetical protein
MVILASALLWSNRVARIGLAVGIALAISGPPARADRVNVPSCTQFVEFGRSWIGLDEDRVSRALGLPLYQLTNGDIDLIGQAIRSCLAAATKADDREILTDGLKRIGSLTTARDRVRNAFSVFESAKKKAAPKLDQITAKLDALQAIPANRAAVDEAQAAISGIFFDLEEKRNRAQVRELLTESFKPYMNALNALARKRRGFAESARLALVAAAEDAFGTHRAEFERLKVP